MSVMMNVFDASLTNIIVYMVFSDAFCSTLKSVFKKWFVSGKKRGSPQPSTLVQRVS